VTRLAPEKRLERALQALSGLIEKVPRSVLALIGDGPDRETLEARAAKMGLGAHVRFPGPVEHDRLPEWYRTADLLLSLLDRTNASNPVFEAMACGRVPVVLDSGATREVVAHGRTGIVVRPEELPALGGVLADLLLDPARRERLGAAAAQAIRELLPTAKERMSYETELLEAAADRRPIGRLPGS
jgi:glycosyltransferase involved in cell wall biosynthesis